jgi:uncharacterized linocin/CFP29 family protein
MDPTIEFLNAGSSLTPVAQRLLTSGFNVNALRTQDVLRKEEWLMFDNTVVDVARHNLPVTGMMISRGLTYDLPNALGHTKLEWEKMSDLGAADISMSGLTQGRNDRLDFTMDSMPIPIVHKDFSLNIRALSASRNGSTPLDTTQAAVAARKVAETVESLIFNGYTGLGANNAIYGFKTATNRITGSVTASWVTATGDQIVGDVIAMINALQAKNMYGPYALMVPLPVHVKFGNDYKAGSDKTIMQRVKEIPGISEIIPSYYLSSSNVLLVQLTSDVADIVDGIQPTTVMWESHGGMMFNFKVLAILVPRIKSTYESQCGIAHYS